jgi:hypothetical protein
MNRDTSRSLERTQCGISLQEHRTNRERAVGHPADFALSLSDGEVSMSDRTTRIVRSPYDDAARLIVAFVAQHRSSDGSVRIGLRLPNALFAERRSVVERRLWAVLYPLHAAGDANQVYPVSWSLEFIGSFPEFNGALAIERGESDDTSVVYVSGDYELLSCDRTADVALFRRIAHACARELLRAIAEFVENACAHDFAARAGYSKPLQLAVLSVSSADSKVLTT